MADVPADKLAREKNTTCILPRAVGAPVAVCAVREHDLGQWEGVGLILGARGGAVAVWQKMPQGGGGTGGDWGWGGSVAGFRVVVGGCWDS